MKQPALSTIEAIASLIAFIVIVGALFHPITVGGRTIASAPHIPFTLPHGPVGYERTERVPLFDAYGPGWIHEANLPYRTGALRAGEWPVWHPHEGCGQPYFAGLLPGLLFPTNALMVLAPAPLGLDLAYLARLVLAGWFTFLLLRVHGVGRIGATAAGIAYLGAGYLATGLNLSNAAVEAMIPGLLFGVELAIRRPGRGSVIAATALVWLTLVGGNPEPTFLGGVLAACYAIARIASVGSLATLGGDRARALARVSIAAIAGALLALPQLLPFLEFVAASAHDHHPVGQAASLRWPLLSVFVFPGLLRGDFAARDLTETGGLYGVSTVAWIAVVAAVFAAFRSGGPRFLTWFAITGLVVGYALYFGAPGFDRLGTLPGFNQIRFGKYAIVFLCLFPALLAGLGIDRIATARSRGAVITLAAAMALVGGGALAVFLAWRAGTFAPLSPDDPRLAPLDPAHPGSFLALWLALGVATVAIACARRPRIAAAVLAVGTLIAAGVHRPQTYPPRRPLFERPAFLDALDGDPRTYRVFSPDELLFPNNAGAFRLNDVRYAEALKIGRYAELVAHLFDHPAAARYFPLPGQRLSMPPRALSLLGVRYALIERRELEPSVGGTTRFDVPPTRGVTALDIRPIDPTRPARATLVAVTPGSERIADDATIDRGTRAFEIDLRVAAEADRVVEAGFLVHPGDRLEIRSITFNGVAIGLDAFRRRVHRRAATHLWVRGESLILTRPNVLPLAGAGHLRITGRKTGGHRVRVALVSRTTSPRNRVEIPAGDDAWRELGALPSGAQGHVMIGDNARVAHRTVPGKPLQPVGGDEHAVVYANPTALPRAFGVYRSEVGGTPKAILERLTSPAFDPQTHVILEEPYPPETMRPDGLPPPEVLWRDESAGGGRVRLDVNFAAAGWLVLLDNHYPGWRAYVDDEKTPIIRANFAFRAVRVPAGRHEVRFEYRPRGIYPALAVALAALIGLFAYPRRWTR